MLTIDGAAGGGQILRTALSLSVVTDTPFEIENIRGNRPNPGLRPQHLTAVEAVRDLCDGDIDGAERGSESLSFEPGHERRTDLEVDIGTAGSVTLLFDTVLPIAVTWDDTVTVTATGGTNVKWSPTVEYLQYVKFPLLARYGFDADLDLAQTGFYPAGGGEATLTVGSSTPRSLDIAERGTLERVEVYSKASTDLEEQEVAQRQADHAAELLDDAGFPVSVETARYVETASTGSSLLVRGVYAEALAGFDELGERGKPSEKVAEDAVGQFREFHRGDGPVDAHMADQVMVPLALAGGRVRIPRVTDHVRTNLDCLGAFGSDVELTGETENRPRLVASAHPAVG